MESVANELRKYVGTHIAQMCEQYGIDTASLSSKEERVQALSSIQEVQEMFLPTGGDPGDHEESIDEPPDRTSIDRDTLTLILAQMREEREHNNRMMLESLATVVGKINSRTESRYIPLKEFRKISGDEDITLWFQTFENLAKRHHIDRDHMCAALEPFLADQAQSAYFTVPLERRNDYEFIKKAIFMRYRLTPSAHRAKFRSEDKQKGETFLDYASRLNSYLRNWLSPSDELMTNTEAVDIFRKIVVDQFISNITDESLHMKLIELENMSLFEIAKFSDIFIQERRAIRNAEGERGPSHPSRDGRWAVPAKQIGPQGPRRY